MKIKDELTNEELAALWDSFDWPVAKDGLFDLQRKLSLCAKSGMKRKVRSLQTEIVQSLSSCMLAVAHVASTTTSKPGVDGVKWIHSHQKMAAAYELCYSKYLAKPTVLVVLQGKRGKDRNLKMFTMHDRAMQTLHSFAVDPIAEVQADSHSFAFRKCRSMMDCHRHVLKMLDIENPPKYVVKADVQQCYESISHKWLYDNITMDKTILKEFLNAGYLFDGELFPTEEGLSLGSAISPLLANMVLDGLQEVVLHKLNSEEIVAGYGKMVRYADDFIVTARTKTQAREMIRAMSRFLRPRGLVLSSTKTKIISMDVGFEFLSRFYQQKDGVLYHEPSESAINRIEEELTELIIAHKGSQQTLINEINSKIRGWASYHKFSNAKDAFRRIDSTVMALLLHMSEKRHKNLTQEYIIKRYFVKEADEEYAYCIPDKRNIRVVRIAKTPLVTYTPPNPSKNPYLDPDYFKEFKEDKKIAYVSGRYRAVWNRQGGKCYYCGRAILPDQSKEITPINPAKPCAGRNMAYAHSKCVSLNVGQLEIYRTKQYFASSVDTLRLLERISEGKERSSIDYRFEALKEYLWMQSKASVTLKYNEIEEILGFSLPPQANNTAWWWQRPGHALIHAGNSVGYTMRYVNPKRRTVTFARGEAATALKIPEAFQKGKIPADAATELTAFFEYICNKYGV